MDRLSQRFEYTFEAMWKAARLFQKEREAVEAASPKSVIRACFRSGFLDEDRARVAMEMAEAIYARLPRYAGLMDSWLAAMEHRSTDQPL